MKIILYLYRIIITLCCFSTLSFAGVEPTVSTILDGDYFINYTGNTLYTTPNPTFQNHITGFGGSSSNYFNTPTGQTIKEINNSLQLFLNPDTKDFINFPFTLNLKVDVKKYELGATSASSVVADLKINYNPTERTIWNEKAIFHFENCGVVDYRVSAVNVTSNGSPLTSQQKELVAKMVGLQSGIVAERYIKFDVNDRLYLTDLGHSYNSTTNELTINWIQVPGAELYDLEWTWVDNYKGDGTLFNQDEFVVNKHYNLDRNSTRVQISERQYTLPLVYENGIIYYRVRAIGKLYDPAVDKIYRLPGKWSNGYNNLPNGPEQCPNLSLSDCGDHTFKIPAAHESDKKNWQITTSYAEEGKRKDVISYMDGTYRNRQSITGLSTDRMTLIGESVYDYQGRAAINILPVPVNDPKLKYYDNFNQNSSGDPYNRTNFDQTRANCDLSADGMSTLSGASRYYSPNNPDKTGEKAYIPDAEKYPFVQTEFTPDNTGRVRRQSGVGVNHNFGSGQETEYFYGTMAQEEGAMLFGIEFGEASHYKKNVAKDPNGQLSVSMLDLKGNVIATALAGTPPKNVDKLESYQPYPMSIDLLAFNQTDIFDNALVASRSFTVTTESDFEFHYEMSNDAYHAALCDGKEICFDCVYDLEIILIDNYSCNDIIYDTLITIGPFQTGLNDSLLIDDTCNGNIVNLDSDLFPTPFTKKLKVGSYTITKKLKVKQRVTDDYVNHYIKVFEKECASVYEDILADQLSRVDSTDCFLDDDDKTPNRCELARMGMLFDLSPGGQYGLIDFSSYNAPDPLSVFNTTASNKLPQANANWKNPSLVFKDLNGNTINHMASSYSLQDFVNDWQAEWAEQLLPFHPEYCYLDWCENNTGTGSFDFDVDLAVINTFNDGVSNSTFYAPIGGNLYAPLPNDPYFQTGSSGATSLGAMSSEISNYNLSSHTMIQVAAMTALQEAGRPHTQNDAQNWVLANQTSSSDSIADKVWQTFSALYLAKKEYYQYLDRTDFAMNCNLTATGKGGYNECIGADPFNWSRNNFGSGFPTNSPFFNEDQPCSVQTFQLYKDKAKRFPSAYDLPGNYDPYGNPQDVLDQGADWAKSMISENCGCLCDSDLQKLLNGIFENRRQTGSTSVQPTTNYLSPILHSRINLLGNGAVLQSISVQLATNGLQIIFNMDDGTVPCPITINFTQSPNFVLEAVDSIDCPIFEASPNGVVFAKIKMYLNDGTIEPATLQVDPSCTLFEACEDKGESCPPTTLAKDFSLLVSQLIGQRKLDQNLAVNNLLGKTLYDEYSIINYDSQGNVDSEAPINWSPQNTANGLSVTFTNGVKTCNFTFDLPSGLNLNTLGAVQSFTPDNTQIDPATGYTKAAILKVALLNSTATVEIKVSNTCFPMSYCLRCPPGGLVAVLQTGGPINTQPQQQVPSNTQNLSRRELRKLKRELNRPASRSGQLRNAQTAQATQLPARNIRLHDPNKICDPCSAEKYAMTYDSMGVMVTRMPSADICDPCSWSLDSLPSIPIPNPCIEEQVLAAYANAHNEYQRILDSLRLKVRGEYIRHCLGAAEKFTVDYTESMHHFTLYYYDQANNLLQTVPPAGVDLLNQAEIAQAIQYMKTKTGTPITPDHDMESEYTYNSLNQLRDQKIPDHDGESIFKYDQLSRIVCSQNAEQRQNNRCSYTLYDDLGRVYEAGEIEGVNSLPNTGNMTATVFRNWTNTTGFTKREITRSIYDEQTAAIANQHFDGDRSNYRGRIASVQYYESNPYAFTHATHYNYDIHGNVKALVQDFNRLLEPKKITYDYDLVSGNVHQVNYQPGALDQFLQKYQYDADNRLITAKSSRDGFIWDTEAEYYYYDHGPLARVEIGEHKVQGIDYAYTIQGWIKGVNSATLNYKADIGQDGIAGTARAFIARDATGYMLGYFMDDYKMIGNTPSAAGWEPTYTGTSSFHNQNLDLFNGNIHNMITAIAPMKNGKLSMGPQAIAFTYDQLHRIKSSQVYTGLDASSNRWATANGIEDYQTKYSFDPNGNLLNLYRNGTTQGGNQLHMDKFKYEYIAGTNKLEYVSDGVSDGNYKMDIDNQNPGNYKYDRIGNLIHDDAENMDIKWNVSGKVKYMGTNVNNSNSQELILSYGPMGNRVSKLFVDNLASKKTYTFYILDATGNVMATYTSDSSLDPQKTKWQSAYIYGGSRLAEERIDTTMQDLKTIRNTQGQDWYSYRSRGSKYYELTEHRNNVLATVSDRKLPVDDDSDKQVDFFEGDIWNVSDYYPYGMQMMERNESFAEVRFGFQGQEMDNDLKGKGNSINYKYRMHDPRLGRFFAVDPLSAKYPYYSSYQFSGNKVVSHVELEGLEEKETGKPKENKSSAPVNYKIKLGDTFYDLEKKWGLKSGTLTKANPDLIPTNLQKDTEINTGSKKQVEVIPKQPEIEINLSERGPWPEAELIHTPSKLKDIVINIKPALPYYLKNINPESSNYINRNLEQSDYLKNTIKYQKLAGLYLEVEGGIKNSQQLLTEITKSDILNHLKVLDQLEWEIKKHVGSEMFKVAGGAAKTATTGEAVYDRASSQHVAYWNLKNYIKESRAFYNGMLNQ